MTAAAAAGAQAAKRAAPAHAWWLEPLDGTGDASAAGGSWADGAANGAGQLLEGLSDDAAAALLRRYGTNTLAARHRLSLLRQFVKRFGNPLILVLLGASAVSAFSRELTNFLIISGIILLSVSLDFVQEYRASAAAEKLRATVSLRATVVRGGKRMQVAASTVVPGDIVLLAAGDLVPADARVLAARDCFVNQALLTGESYPVEKRAQPPPTSAGIGAGTTEAAAASADLQGATNAVFMGASVVSGSATVRVARTGLSTAIGEVAERIARAPPPTAFEAATRRFGGMIMRLTVLMVLFVLLVNTLFHRPLLESFLFAVALAVGLTPELLPMVVSVTLARGALRMAALHMIVKRMTAIEDLGSMDVLCTDKTGTLTEATIRMERHVDAGGRTSARVLELAYLNSVFETGLKSPLDDAILVAHAGGAGAGAGAGAGGGGGDNGRGGGTAAGAGAAANSGVRANAGTGAAANVAAGADATADLEVRPHNSPWQKIDEVPFDFERRRVSVLIDDGSQRWLVVKGAAADIVALCTEYEGGGQYGTDGAADAGTGLGGNASGAAMQCKPRSEASNGDGPRDAGMSGPGPPIERERSDVADGDAAAERALADVAARAAQAVRAEAASAQCGAPLDQAHAAISDRATPSSPGQTVAQRDGPAERVGAIAEHGGPAERVRAIAEHGGSGGHAQAGAEHDRPTERGLSDKEQATGDKVVAAPDQGIPSVDNFGGGHRPIDRAARAAIEQRYRSLEADGLRVLGVAWRQVARSHPHAVVGDEAALVLAGFAAFSDPPKAGAAQALADIGALGVNIKVVTGDSELVTRHLSAQLGLPVTAVVSGAELAGADDQALGALVERANLFCRIDPLQKSRIILALKARGHVVGYLGDGVNDAPSLHAADVGLSVDSAVDVAREAADMILLRQDLRVIHDAVLEGRRTFVNIMKYIAMGTSSNFGNMFSMAGAALFLPFLPMLPTQILLNNILYDLSEVPIPFDRVDARETAQPRVLDLHFVRSFMVVVGSVSSMFDFLTFYVLLRVLQAGPALFRSGWFVESLCTQVLVIFVIRTRGNPLRSRPHPLLTATSLAVVALALLLPLTHAGAWFGLVPLPALLYAWLAAMVLLYLLVAELVKQLFYRHLDGAGLERSARTRVQA